jgi:hypothetical protein
MLQPPRAREPTRQGQTPPRVRPQKRPTPGCQRNLEPRRVPGTRVAKALDEIIKRRHLDRPYTLYRYIAEQSGVHSTTVLRYHSGYLRSTQPAVYECIRELLARVRTGHELPFEDLATGGSTTHRPPRPTRVPVAQVRRALSEVLRSLGLGPRQILFRYLAERTGIHPSTVLRYYQGDLQTAPRALVEEIDRLRRRIVAGEAVVFRQGPDGTEVVLRSRTRSIVEELLRERGGGDGQSCFQELDCRLALPPGTTRRICTDPDLYIVQADIHLAVEKFVHGVAYDPVQTYCVGDRIRHHMFGLGTVKEKIHKNKIRVEYCGGKQVILSEAVPEDPYRYFRLGGGGTLMEDGA